MERFSFSGVTVLQNHKNVITSYGGTVRCAVEFPFAFIWSRLVLLSVAVKNKRFIQIRNKKRNMIIRFLCPASGHKQGFYYTQPA
jgi:hypothetical protein